MPVKKPRFTLIDSIAPRIQTRKALFLRKMEQLVDWHALSGVMAGAYASRVSMADAAGRPAYPPILLLKMLLLETWYGLSDTEAEEFALDSLTARQFLGLSLEDRVPDHSSLSRFRARLLSLALYAPLLAEVNRQLEAAGVIVRTGAILDASILETPRRPHRKPRYVVADDREPNQTPGDRAGEEGYHAMLRAEQPGVDPSARWAIKRGPRFGYKRHTVTDPEGFVLGETVTPANVPDTLQFAEALGRIALPAGARVYADKGYDSQANRAYLAARGLRDGIMRRKPRGEGMRESAKRRNRLISGVRGRVELAFAGIKRWFKSGQCRYVGLARTRGQCALEAMALNLFLAPGKILRDARR